jgi:hypothetical protein
MPHLPTRPVLTTRDILGLFLPLAATSTMMSVSTPIINAGLARMPDPELNLAAFGIAFTLSVFLESPVFALQQAIIAWYRGSGSIRSFVRFSVGLGLALTVVECLIVFTPAAPFIFRRLLGASEELTGPAVLALRAGVLFPLLVAVRSAYQGVLVGRRRSAPIAVGTFLRLLFLAVMVFTVVPRVSWGGPVAAMLALAAAVLVETIYVIVLTMRTPEKEEGTSPAHEAGRSLPGKVRFLAPLAWTMVLGSLTNPLVNAFIARTPSPEQGLAVFSVVASLIWFMASSVLRFSSVTIALGTTRANLRRLERFVWRYVGSVCAAVFLVTLTPAAGILLERVIGLSPELAARARLPFALLSLQPLVAGFIAYQQGILTRSAHTAAVGFAGMSRVIAIAGLGAVGIAMGMRGGLLGAILLGSAFVAELLTLLVLRGRPRVVWPWGARA